MRPGLWVVKVYHRTLQSEEEPGRRGGGVMTDEMLVGVWVSTAPPRSRAEHAGRVVGFDVPDSLFERFEWVDDAKPFREALIPAPILHRYGRRAWVEPDGAEQAPGESPQRLAAGGKARRADRWRGALRAGVAVSAVLVAHRAWKRRPWAG